MAGLLKRADVPVKLAEFFRWQSGLPFVWGGADCGLYLADWTAFAIGIDDPAAAVRGTYSDQTGADRILTEHGGFIAYVTALAEIAGCPVISMPADGDFGIIDMRAGLTGAIMTAGSWAFRTPKGLAWTRLPAGRTVKAWTVCDA